MLCFMCQPLQRVKSNTRGLNMEDDWYKELEFYPMETRLKLLALRIAQNAFRGRVQWSETND